MVPRVARGGRACAQARRHALRLRFFGDSRRHQGGRRAVLHGLSLAGVALQKQGESRQGLGAFPRERPAFSQRPPAHVQRGRRADSLRRAYAEIPGASAGRDEPIRQGQQDRTRRLDPTSDGREGERRDRDSHDLQRHGRKDRAPHAEARGAVAPARAGVVESRRLGARPVFRFRHDTGRGRAAWPSLAGLREGAAIYEWAIERIERVVRRSVAEWIDLDRRTAQRRESIR